MTERTKWKEILVDGGKGREGHSILPHCRTRKWGTTVWAVTVPCMAIRGQVGQDLLPSCVV